MNSKNENSAMSAPNGIGLEARIGRMLSGLGTRSIVLVGIMGCGKSSVGRRLAQRIGLPFVDADNAIEEAANMSVAEIFAEHGEPYFRSGEERVIARLLGDGPQVLATGGGAYMSETTRNAIMSQGISVWLKADLDTVMARVRKKSTRPLLQNPDPEGVMRGLLETREPIYALSDLMVHSRDVPHETVMEEIIAAVDDYLQNELIETPAQETE